MSPDSRDDVPVVRLQQVDAGEPDALGGLREVAERNLARSTNARLIVDADLRPDEAGTGNREPGTGNG